MLYPQKTQFTDPAFLHFRKLCVVLIAAFSTCGTFTSRRSEGLNVPRDLSSNISHFCTNATWPPLQIPDETWRRPMHSQFRSSVIWWDADDVLILSNSLWQAHISYSGIRIAFRPTFFDDAPSRSYSSSISLKIGCVNRCFIIFSKTTARSC